VAKVFIMSAMQMELENLKKTDGWTGYARFVVGLSVRDTTHTETEVNHIHTTNAKATTATSAVKN
jgi:menaquinone-dependent protoporphyrinogen IX oxidase